MISVVLASCHPAMKMTEAAARLLPQCHRLGAELIVARAATAGPETDPVPDGCRLVRCRSGATIPEVRGTGLAAAAGDWVLLTEDSCVVGTDWVERMVAGCTPEADVVGGSIGSTGSARSIDAAAGFAEYGMYGPLQVSRGAPALACANIAYQRRVVADVAAWSLAGQWENEIHGRLAQRGARFRLVADARVVQHLQYQVGPFCRNRYQHGRDYAAVRSRHLSAMTRFLLTCTMPLLPALMTWRVWRRAGRAAPGTFVRALPLTLTFFGAWSIGEATGYLRGRGAR